MGIHFWCKNRQSTLPPNTITNKPIKQPIFVKPQTTPQNGAGPPYSGISSSLNAGVEGYGLDSSAVCMD